MTQRMRRGKTCEFLSMDPQPLSLLNDYLYCRRRAGLKAIEGLRSSNEHTVRGDAVHEHVDFPGYEKRAGSVLWRALPVWSDRWLLSGKCDLVEATLSQGKPVTMRPVEYKKGPKRKWENDEVQLCAQALCLEEMFGIAITEGAIFHAQSQQRHTVPMDDSLRRETQQTIQALHDLAASGIVPPAILTPQCKGCSLHEICAPELSAHATWMNRELKALYDAEEQP